MALSPNQYANYIQSEAWQEKRRAYWQSRLPKNCYICKSPPRPGFHLHHKTYKRLGEENIGVDLVPCCPECHEEIHRVQKETNLHIWIAGKLAKKQYRRRMRKKLRRGHG